MAALSTNPPPTSPPAKAAKGPGPKISGAGIIEDTEEIKKQKGQEQEELLAKVAEPNPAEVAPVAPVLGYVLNRGGRVCTRFYDAYSHVNADETPSLLPKLTARLAMLRSLPPLPPTLRRRLTVTGTREERRTNATTAAMPVPPATRV